MKLDPTQEKTNKIFYNTISTILLIASIVFLFTAINYNRQKSTIYGENFKQELTIGPIVVKNAPEIYRLYGRFKGSNSSDDLNGSIIDEKGNTIYSFSKDLYHESGYDSDGYWSEEDRKIYVDLNFYNNGKYYISLDKDNNKESIYVNLSKSKGSYVPHYMIGLWLFLLGILGSLIVNKENIKTFTTSIIESMEE